MLAIMINHTTAPIVAAMNNGVTPLVNEYEAEYFIYEDETVVPYILSYEDFWKYRKDNVTKWATLDFIIWSK